MTARCERFSVTAFVAGICLTLASCADQNLWNRDFGRAQDSKAADALTKTNITGYWEGQVSMGGVRARIEPARITLALKCDKAGKILSQGSAPIVFNADHPVRMTLVEDLSSGKDEKCAVSASTRVTSFATGSAKMAFWSSILPVRPSPSSRNFRIDPVIRGEPGAARPPTPLLRPSARAPWPRDLAPDTPPACHCPATSDEAQRTAQCRACLSSIPADPPRECLLREAATIRPRRDRLPGVGKTTNASSNCPFRLSSAISRKINCDKA